MKLSEIKTHLNSMQAVNFRLPDGSLIPEHFHVTEVGQITKKFIDCGGTVRSEKLVNFQLWEANDYDHRLAAEKLNKIIDSSEKILHIEDAEIEIEYQTDTIGKFGLELNGNEFQLTNKSTNCLASDHCGIPKEKVKLQMAELGNTQNTCCSPGAGCC